MGIDDFQATAIPGLPISYTIIVTNLGPDPAAATNILDSFPAALLGVTWSCNATPGSVCPAGGAGNINHTADIASGGTLVYLVNATVDPCATGNLIDTVSAIPGPGVVDPGGASATATDTDVLTPQVDLVLSQVDRFDPQYVCRDIRYTLTVLNRGPSCAANVTLVHTAPSATTFVSTTPVAPACGNAGDTVTCGLGTLAPLATTSADVVVNVDFSARGASLTNTASVSSDPSELVPADNSGSIDTRIRTDDPYILAVHQTPNALRIGKVTTLDYTVKVRSLCAAHAETTNVKITNIVPADLDIQQVTPSPTSLANNQVTYEFPTMAGGTSSQFSIRTTLADSADPGACLLDTVTLTDDHGSKTTKEVVANVRGLVRKPPRIPPDLRVALTTPLNLMRGKASSQALAVVNSGRTPLSNLTVTLTEPIDVEFVSSLPAPSSITVDGSMRTLTWTLASMKAPGTTRIRLLQKASATASTCAYFELTSTVASPDGQTDSETRAVRVRNLN